ncbi:tandem-95 repeat protein, partial [candidate division GN15 bacterium]|nr:tandem-95 repeat protein [candidate division GN15 bacterium]
MLHMRQVLALLIILTVFAVGASAQTAPPVLDPIGAQSIDEGLTLTIPVTASDADGTTPTLTTSTPLPANAGFTDNGNGTGEFTFSPDFTQAGTFNVTFYANDVATADVDSEQVVITVNEAIGVSSVTLSSTSGTDVTTDDLTVSYTLDGGATHAATAWYRDGSPAMAAFFPFEGGAANATTDVSGNGVVLTPTGSPTWSATGGHDGRGGYNFDGTSYFVNTTAFPTQSSYTKMAWVRRTDDGGLNSGNIISGTSPNTNSHAFWAPSNNSYRLSAGHNGAWTTVQDPTPLALDTWYHVALTFDYSTGVMRLYKNGVEVDNAVSAVVDVLDSELHIGSYGTVYPWSGDLDDVRVYNYALSPDQVAGIFNGNTDVLEAAETSRGESWRADVTSFTDTQISPTEASNSITIQNAAPTLATIGNQTVAEGGTLNLGITASDPDGDFPALTTSTLPPNATFVDNGDGTGDFSFSPDFTQAGSVDITFTATDDQSVTDQETITITITNTNRAPVFTPQADTTIDEGQALTLTVSATDADGESLTMTAQNLPAANASFADNGDNSGTLTFTPDFTQSGTYPIDFTATDGTDPTTITVNVTVAQVNLAPTLDPIGPQTVDEGGTLNLTINASDPDGNLASLTATGLPTNATFVDQGGGTGQFTFSP